MEYYNFLKGTLHLLDSKYSQSIDEIRKLITTNDSPKEVYILLGSILRKNKEYDKAIHIHESLVGDKTINNNLYKILYFELVKDYKQSQDYKKSLFYAEKLHNIDNSPIILKYLYELHLINKNFDQAYKFLTKYQKVTKKDFSKELSYILYEKYKSADKQDDSLIKKGLKLYPNNRPFNLIAFDKILKTGKLPKAFDKFNEILEKNILKTEADLKKFETIFFEAGMFKEFESAIFKVLAKSSTNPIYTVYAITMFKKKGNFEKAKELLENFLKKIGEKQIIVNTYFDMILDTEIKDKFKANIIYKCSKCGSNHKDYSEYCSSCKGIETLDFA